LVLHSGVI